MLIKTILIPLLEFLIKVVEKRGLDISLLFYRDHSFVDKLLSMQFQSVLKSSEVCKMQLKLLSELESKLIQGQNDYDGFGLEKYYQYLDFLQKFASIEDKLIQLENHNKDLWNKYVIFDNFRNKSK